MTLIFSRSIFANWPCDASSSTCWATISASSCAVSVAGTVEGGTPQPTGSKSTDGRNPPRFAYVLSGTVGSGS